MATIEQIKQHGETLSQIIGTRELTKDEWAIIKIYNGLYAKKSPLAGKRVSIDSSGAKRYR